jgi:hypothetical protein
MKKLVLAGLMTGLCMSLFAEGQTSATPADKQPAKQEASAPAAPACKPAAIEKWESIQFGFWFGFPPSTQKNNVCGIKIGAPFCDGPVKVSGLETALFSGATDTINGVQACVLVAVSKQLEGLQFSIVNIGKTVKGLQLGIINIAQSQSFQVGLINYIEGNNIPCLPIINYKF